MARKILELKATKRTGTPGAIRAAGAVPAVLYGHGVSNEAVQVEAKVLLKILGEAGHTALVDLDVDGTTHNVLIREVQFHPLREQALHADFYQVRMDEAVRAEVPLEFVGESAAVKDLGGVLLRNTDAVEVEALPRDLPRSIEVDISGLIDFEKTITVADLVLPDGVEVLDEPENVVALVQAPRTEEELESLSEDVTEDVESVEGVVKPETPEEGAAEGEASEGTAGGEGEKKEE